jgi:hypothetical protein
MIADGLWLDRKQRQKRVHQPRPRRDRVGELVQVDGSEHWWFEASTLAEGNALLPAFMADYNARFAKAPANGKDLHRRLSPGNDLDDAFAWKEERTLSRALTLQYDKILFILEPSATAKTAIGKRVTVVDYPDGRLSIRYRGVELAYRTFDKLRQVDQGAIANHKRLGAVLAMIRDEQLRREPERRSGPRRRDQRDARLFKVG